MPFIVNKVVTQTITEEKKMPITFAANALLRSILNKYVAILPAYTPVPGSGIITKRISPQKPYFWILDPDPVLALRATQIAPFL